MKKILVLLALLLMVSSTFLVLTPQIDAQETLTAKMLIVEFPEISDEVGPENAYMDEWLTELGYSFDYITYDLVLTKELLDDYDVLILRKSINQFIGAVAREYGADEMDVIETFVSEGGGLYIEGEEFYMPTHDVALIFGIDIDEYNYAIGWPGHITDFIEHEITQGVHDVYITGTAHFILSMPATKIATSVAISEWGSGRVFVIGDVHLDTIGYGDAGYDNKQLFLNVMKWLAQIITPPYPQVFDFELPTPNSSPHAITTDREGNIWVLESATNKLVKFKPPSVITEDTQLQFQEFQAPSDPWAAYGANAIAFDSFGNVWFAEMDANKIAKFDPETETFTEFDIPTANSYPLNLAVDSRDRVWFIESSTVPHDRPQLVGMLDPATGAFQEFVVPTYHAHLWGIAVDEENKVWFTEHEGDKIGVIDPETGLITEYPVPTPGAIPFFLGNLFELTFDAQGNIWYAAGASGNLGFFDRTTRAFNEYFTPIKVVDEPGVGIAIDSRGRIWSPRMHSNTIMMFDPATLQFTEYQVPTEGKPYDRFGPRLSTMPWGITIDKSGNVWFTESLTDKVGVVSLARATATTHLEGAIGSFEALEDTLVAMDPGAYDDVLDQYLNPALSYIVDDNYLYIDDQDGVKKGETAFDMLKEAVDKIQNNFLDPETLDEDEEAELVAIQEEIVEVARLLAITLLNELEQAGLSDPDAVEEYSIGEEYFSEAPNQSTYGDQIAMYKDAWKQGVKALELEWGITSGIAGPP